MLLFNKTISAVFLIILIYSNSAFAFDFIGVRWFDEDIPITFSINRTNFSDCEVDAIKRAFEKWGSIDGSKLEFQFVGIELTPIRQTPFMSSL